MFSVDEPDYRTVEELEEEWDSPTWFVSYEPEEILLEAEKAGLIVRYNAEAEYSDYTNKGEILYKKEIRQAYCYNKNKNPDLVDNEIKLVKILLECASESVCLQMPPEEHPFHSPSLSAAILCWNVLFKDRPFYFSKPKDGYIIEITTWLKKNFPDRQILSGNKIDLIAELLNPDPKGSPPPSRTQTYRQNPDVDKTYIELLRRHPFASEKLIAAIRCWNYLYEDKTAPAPLTRKDPQRGKILEWLKTFYRNLDDTPRGHIAKVVNPNPTGR